MKSSYNYIERIWYVVRIADKGWSSSGVGRGANKSRNVTQCLRTDGLLWTR